LPDQQPAAVHWVTEERPAAAGGGGAIRQAGLLRALLADHEVHLLTTAGPPDADLAGALASITEVPGRTTPSALDKARWVALGLAGRGTPELAAAAEVRDRLAAHLREVPAGSIVVLNHPALAPLVELRADVRWVLELQYEPATQLIQEAPWSNGARRLRLQRYAAATRRAEVRLFPRAHRVVLPSDEDAAPVRAVVPDARVLIVPNALDPARYTPTPIPARPLVVLPGTLDFPPNVDGAQWLVTDVWPLVRQAVPGAELALVGRSPTAAIRALDGSDGVAVHADVPDMGVWFGQARVIAVPLRFGTGTRLKALEAMALRRPLVGTPIGLAGLDLTDGVQALVADEPAAFAAALARTLVEDMGAMVRAAAALLHERFTWDHVGRRFVEGITAP
jgi:glycosyltransferase involved in cell wall biosynthesis